MRFCWFFVLFLLFGQAQAELRWESGVGYDYPAELNSIGGQSWKARTLLTEFSLMLGGSVSSSSTAQSLLRKVAAKSGWEPNISNFEVRGSSDAARLDHSNLSAICFKHDLLDTFAVILVTKQSDQKANSEAESLIRSLRNDPVEYAKRQTTRSRQQQPVVWHTVKAPSEIWSLNLPGESSKLQEYHATYASCELIAYWKPMKAVFTVREIPRMDLATMKDWLTRFEMGRGLETVWIKTGRSDLISSYVDTHDKSTFRRAINYLQLPGKVVLNIELSGDVEDVRKAQSLLDKVIGSVKVLK
jgi:hypothetical protein